MKIFGFIIAVLSAALLSASEPKVVRYEDFGAKGDGKTNDAVALIKAHNYANKHQLPVRARDDAHYYIGEMSKSIVIQTNTDFGKARFTIDDRKLSQKCSRRPVFSIIPERKMTAAGIGKFVKTLKKGQTKIDVKLKYPSLVTVRNKHHKQFIRWGVNANNGSEMRDLFLVDKNGNIDPTTPIVWDFDQLTYAVARPIPPEKLIIRGGVFTTLANAEKGPHRYYSRNIHLSRSNTVVEGLTHLVKEPDSKESYPYAGFLSISNCANVLVKDCVFTGRKQYFCVKPNSKSTSTGTYDLSINTTINVTFLNCTQSNNIYAREYWGIMGSNYCKNLTYDNCRLSRFDAHQGVCNAVIRNSEVGKSGIHVTGYGKLLVENCIIRTSRIVNLRQDYGSFWDGDIEIKNCTWFIGRQPEPAVLTGRNTGEHDFGYKCRMPRSIKIENLLIKDKKHHRRYKGAALLSTFTPHYSPSLKYPIEVPEKIIIKNLRSESGKDVFLSTDKNMYKNVKVIRQK